MSYSYGIVPNMNIDKPELSDVVFMRDFDIGEFFLTKEDNQYKYTSDLKYGDRYLMTSMSSITDNRTTTLMQYYTFFDSGKLMNLIPGYEYYYQDEYSDPVVNGIYLDKYGKYLVTDSTGFIRSSDGFKWTKYTVNQRLSKVLSSYEFDFIVQGFGNLLYHGDYDGILNETDTSLKVMQYNVEENPQTFVIPLSGYDISAYSFGLYNVYNNAMLMKYDNETKIF